MPSFLSAASQHQQRFLQWQQAGSRGRWRPAGPGALSSHCIWLVHPHAFDKDHYGSFIYRWQAIGALSEHRWLLISHQWEMMNNQYGIRFILFLNQSCDGFPFPPPFVCVCVCVAESVESSTGLSHVPVLCVDMTACNLIVVIKNHRQPGQSPEIEPCWNLTLRHVYVHLHSNQSSFYHLIYLSV